MTTAALQCPIIIFLPDTDESILELEKIYKNFTGQRTLHGTYHYVYYELETFVQQKVFADFFLNISRLSKQMEKELALSDINRVRSLSQDIYNYISSRLENYKDADFDANDNSM